MLMLILVIVLLAIYCYYNMPDISQNSECYTNYSYKVEFMGGSPPPLTVHKKKNVFSGVSFNNKNFIWILNNDHSVSTKDKYGTTSRISLYSWKVSKNGVYTFVNRNNTVLVTLTPI
jgi:hypothetical protein